MCVETFNNNKSDLREGKEKINKLFTDLGSVLVAKNCDLGLENAALDLWPRATFSRPRSQFLTIRTSQLVTYIYPQSKLVFPSKHTNKIYRFVKIPLFAVAQAMLNNFIVLVYF